MDEEITEATVVEAGGREGADADVEEAAAAVVVVVVVVVLEDWYTYHCDGSWRIRCTYKNLQGLVQTSNSRQKNSKGREGSYCGPTGCSTTAPHEIPRL